MYTTRNAFLFWLLTFIGGAGAHRFYLGKYGTGVLWFLTGGLMGIGTLYDLFTLRAQVDEANRREYYRKALSGGAQAALIAQSAEVAKKESIERVILRCARKNAGFVTPAEVALDGDVSIEAAKLALEKLASKGFADMRVRTNGVIVYVFQEFQKEGTRDFAV